MKLSYFFIIGISFLSSAVALCQPVRYYNKNINHVPTATTLYLQKAIQSKISATKKQFIHNQQVFHDEYKKFENSLYENRSFLCGLITYSVPKYRLFGHYMLQPWKQYKNQLDVAIDDEMQKLHKVENYVKKAKAEELVRILDLLHEKY